MQAPHAPADHGADRPPHHRARDKALAVQCEGLCKHYPHFELQDVDLSFERGTVMGLVGPNGAGKSTILRIVMGLVGADSGRVEVLGHPMPDEQVAAKYQIGFVAEDMRLSRDGQGVYPGEAARQRPRIRRVVADDEIRFLVRLQPRDRAPRDVPMMTMVFLGVFVVYAGILGVGLLSQSLGTTILGILFFEVGTSVYLWVVAYLDPIRSHLSGPVAVWNGTAIAVVTLQALLGTAAIVATLVIQTRRRDFV